MLTRLPRSLRPEIEEVVPLKRRPLSEIGKTRRVPRRMRCEGRVASGPWQLDAGREFLEGQPVAALLAQAEQEIDRAAEKMGENVGAIGEGGRLAEERSPADPPAAAHRRAVAGDGYPFAARDALPQEDAGVGADLRHLEQVGG